MAMIATAMPATIIPYSTAVAPSSSFRNLLILSMPYSFRFVVGCCTAAPKPRWHETKASSVPRRRDNRPPSPAMSLSHWNLLSFFRKNLHAHPSQTRKPPSGGRAPPAPRAGSAQGAPFLHGVCNALRKCVQGFASVCEVRCTLGRPCGEAALRPLRKERSFGGCAGCVLRGSKTVMGKGEILCRWNHGDSRPSRFFRPAPRPPRARFERRKVAHNLHRHHKRKSTVFLQRGTTGSSMLFCPVQVSPRKARSGAGGFSPRRPPFPAPPGFRKTAEPAQPPGPRT